MAVRKFYHKKQYLLGNNFGNSRNEYNMLDG